MFDLSTVFVSHDCISCRPADKKNTCKSRQVKDIEKRKLLEKCLNAMPFNAKNSNKHWKATD